MDDSLGNQIATSAVPGVGYNRVPSSSRLATGGGQPTGEPVTWDEMGQLGLHKALNEYYKLSDSQRNLRMCQRGGAPSILCCMAHTLLIPQLPAAVSPPALFATAGWLLYAAGWLLYQTAAITIPLALWLAFAAGGSLSLSPAAVAAAARLHPAAGAAAARLAAGGVALPPPLTGHPLAATLVLPALLVVLRLAERAVLARWQQQWDRQHARVTAADVQARYEGWALPGTAAASPVAPLAAVGQQQEHVRRQQLELLRREVGALWAAVYGGESPPLEQLEGLQEIAAVVGRLCADTGVEVPPAAAAGNTGVDSRFLLSLVRQVQAAVGVA